MKDLLSYCDEHFLIGNKKTDQNNDPYIDASLSLMYSGQVLNYQYFSPEPWDHLRRTPEQAYIAIIREHEVKPGLYTIHPKKRANQCPKDQLQPIFLSILLNRDKDRALILLFRIITRLGFWQDWRKNPLKSIMLPSDCSTLVRALILFNKKWLILYPILLIADLLNTIDLILSKNLKTLKQHAKLEAQVAASTYIKTPLTYLNVWLFNNLNLNLISRIQEAPTTPPVHTIKQRFKSKHFSQNKTHKAIAILSATILIAALFISIYKAYTLAENLRLPKMELKQLVCKDIKNA